jgi:hypothetical protein
MKFFSILLCGIFLLSAASCLQAGEVILYTGFQRPGKLTWSSATTVSGDMLKGQNGNGYGARLSAGRVVGFEQNFCYSPRFAKPGVKAFQMDSNLVIQAQGKIVPYVTAGIGFVNTWGQDFSADLDPGQIAASAFSFAKKFSINYGGGLKLRRILGPLGFNVDMRGYTLPGARDEGLKFTQISVGAMFTW